jgi:hypothetical protein
METIPIPGAEIYYDKNFLIIRMFVAPLPVFREQGSRQSGSGSVLVK